MSHSFMRGCSLALAGAFMAQTALAGISAEEVWSEWRDYLTGMGYEVSGSESASGGTLTVSDFVLSLTMPEDAGVFALAAPQITFSENGDGTVSVTVPETLPVTFSATGDEKVDGELVITQTRPVLLVSGDPDDLTYSYAADAMGLALKSLKVDGAAVPADVIALKAAAEALKSETRLLVGKARSYSQTMSVGSLSYEMSFRDPESGENGAFSGNLEGIGFEGAGTIPTDIAADDFDGLIASGFAIDATFSYAASSSAAKIDAEGETFSYDGSSGGGALEVAMDARHIAYSVTQERPTIRLFTSEFPLPLEIAASRLGFSFDMPVAASEQEQPYAFGLTIAELSVPDTLWGIFDPQGILPRDPATLIVDIAGKARLSENLLDPAVAERMDRTGAAPGQVESVSIRKFLLSAVGASLSGSGDFTLDNTDLESFDGFPRPAGVLRLTVTGANALLDRLIRMGLVAEQDAMGFRMMIGMLTVPGEGEDTLKSTIEITDNGQILANGQRLK